MSDVQDGEVYSGSSTAFQSVDVLIRILWAQSLTNKIIACLLIGPADYIFGVNSIRWDFFQTIVPSLARIYDEVLLSSIHLNQVID
jgi:hypothetical protein